MHREGHYGAALIAYAPLAFVAAVTGFNLVAIGGAVVTVALAIVPDYDLQIPGFQHRGFSHTVWFALLVGTGCGVASGVIGVTDGVIGTIGLGVFGFLVGTGAICSHIAADAVTPMGVQPLVPVDERHISYNITRASNPLANYVLLALGVIMAAGGYCRFRHELLDTIDRQPVTRI